MNACAKKLIVRLFAMLFALTLTLIVVHGSAHAQDRPPIAQPQLDQMLAPIALYPDALLSQILMAATYPLEVVEAARWSRRNPGLVGDDAVRAAERENWDPSVKSLLAFPQVLARMDENLQWTQALGDAFLDQEPQVMDTVQYLRRRAQAAGNLRSDERQSVVEYGPTVVVQPANPQIIYVPYYDPMVVYGSWWWPEYRPVYWRPFPGYYARPGFAASFFWGPSIRISAGFFFGAFDWPQREVRVVRVNNYYYNNATVNRRESVIHRENNVYVGRAPDAWQHDPDHRRGVAYRSPIVQQRFPGAGARPDRGDVNRPAVQPAAQPATQAAVQPVVQPHVGADPRAERQGIRVERGDRSERIERRPEPRAAEVIPQARESRGDTPPMRRDTAERVERPRASEPRPELSREPATRLEAPRAVEVHAAISHPQLEMHREAGPRPEPTRVAEAQPRTPRVQPEARHEAGGQHGAHAEDAGRRPREQR